MDATQATEVSKTILGMDVGEFVSRAIFLAVVVAIAYLVQRALGRLLRRLLDSSNVPSASIFVNLVRGLVWVIALLTVLKPVFGVDPSGFVAALGVTSVVISFGLQDTVSNVVAGLGLMLGKVVQPGDQITVGGYSGEVVDVTWRNTVVRDRGGATEVIPNSVLNKTALTRRTRWDVTDVAVPLVVRADADLAAVTQDILDTGAQVLADVVDPDVEPTVMFKAATALGIECVAHFHVVDAAVPSAQVDRVLRALAGRPWLAQVDVREAGAC